MDRYERQLAAVEREMRETLAKARAYTDAAAKEGRGLSEDEDAELQTHLKAVETLREKRDEVRAAIAVRERVDAIGEAIEVIDGDGKSDVPAAQRARSLGEAFVKSDGYKALKERGVHGQWSTGSIDINAKALFDSGSAGSEANGLIQPDVQPGILPILTERLTVADLMAQGTTSSPLVRYMVEKVATSGAAGVPESGDKPESTIEFDAEDEPVKKIATFLPVTDEMIEDVEGLQSYINARLSRFVREEEEAQLLDGAGGDDLEGLLGRIPAGNLGVNAGALTTASNAADHVFAAMTKVREAFVEPTAIVMHPDDWASIALLKDGQDRYIAGGPFAAQPETLWGKRVVVTAAMDAGSALVGDFQSAQVYRKGGLSVEASNSHADYFRKNKTAIRAEERLALAVYRPAAFATADLAIVS